MAVTSRSSRPRQPAAAEQPVSKITRTRASRQRVIDEVPDDSDHDNDVLSHPRHISIRNSKSLPNLAHPQENLRKRPPSSPPSPTRSRPRAPLAVHQPASQHTPVDNDHTLDNDHRPVKKALRDQRRSAPVATFPLHGRDSPDPLNTIDSPDNDSPRTRPAAVSRRSTRRTTQPRPVVIANDVGSNGVAAATTGSEAAGNGADHVVVGQDEKSKSSVDAPQPAVPERRSLRSHDGGSRSKSELALYFPNYEQMISLEPPKPGKTNEAKFLSAETTVVLLDDLTESPLPPSPLSSPSKSRKRKSSSQDSPFGNPLVNLHACEVIDLPEPADNASQTDPLGDEVYFKAHRRNERQEKQLRNIEKERAQHEKVQLDRLLDELQGHDWLRVMGISGITDTEKKLYEPKRDLFIKEVSALIEKFRVWKEEEKRRKLKREQMLAAAAAATGDEEADQHGEQAAEEEENEEEGEEQAEDEEEQADEVEEPRPSSSDIQSYGEPPDPNDVDAWAARQLLQEARSASASKRSRTVDEPQPQPPEEPFRSFYTKRYLRDAAINGHRRGRFRTAFGQPIPEMEEREFRLPDDILTPEVLSSMMRKRRRLKRESRGS
ncbi:hypothetical protein VTN77DRAFT_8458 [Rasamsonia byssochlamydoides]|uniref:uncharacterized protein n=1 Tax=Rasamsonia byssochlamydoides TaxID=89139 RepID=UPI0037421F91